MKIYRYYNPTTRIDHFVPESKYYASKELAIQASGERCFVYEGIGYRKRPTWTCRLYQHHIIEEIDVIGSEK